MFRANSQQKQRPCHRQGGLSRLGRCGAKGKLLPFHHLALDGDHLPLQGQPQPISLPAGQGQGVPGTGAIADGAGRLELPVLCRGIPRQQYRAAPALQAGRFSGYPGRDDQ